MNLLCASNILCVLNIGTHSSMSSKGRVCYLIWYWSIPMQHPHTLSCRLLDTKTQIKYLLGLVWYEAIFVCIFCMSPFCRPFLYAFSSTVLALHLPKQTSFWHNCPQAGRWMFFNGRQLLLWLLFLLWLNNQIPCSVLIVSFFHSALEKLVGLVPILAWTKWCKCWTRLEDIT